MPKLTYCVLTMNRLAELQNVVRHTAPHVDRTIIIDGCSTDGTVEWLQSDECKELKVEFQCIPQHLYQYGNHNPDKRNPYIRMAGDEGWMLVMDDDELLKEDARRMLRPLIMMAEAQGYDGIKFQPHDIWMMEDGSVKDVQHKDFWAPMLWKIYPGQEYKGHTHVYIDRPGAKNNWLQTNYQYVHRKDERRLWRNSTQNYWTTVGLATNNTEDETWLGFHKLMQKYGHTDWHEFDKEMTKGNLPAEIQDWFFNHRDAENPEERAWFVWYFIFLHPEENTWGIDNRDRPWDYLKQCQLKRQG